MKTILPNSIFIGFTGTPLLKNDKKTSLEIFGGYIHTYKFDEAVRDGVVLDLRYEARNVPQDISSQQAIDLWFDAKTQGLSSRGKARLKQYWGNIQSVYSSKSRLEKIAKDIVFDFNIVPRLSEDNGGNAILVADSIYSACKYYEIFQGMGFKKCAVVSSYTPQAGDLRTDTVSDDEDTETFEKYTIYRKMIGINEGDDSENVAKKVEEFEKEAKRKFVDEPANMKLLIVVDKLLTGFDAPPCTYLYIDKAMHDHGLFQAICRVNRLDGEEKDFGYIVDYKELFGDIADAMNTYTAGAFESYDEEDVKDLLKNRKDEARKYFQDTLDALAELCDGVADPREELQYIQYFCGENGVDEDVDEAYARSREKLYRLVSRLLRAYSEVKQYMDELGYTQAQRAKFEIDVNFYVNLKETIGRASADFIDLKMYEPGMRYLIDNYIEASDAAKIGVFDDFTLLDFIISQEEKFDSTAPKGQTDSAAETIENNIRKKVVQKIVINPAYYSKMSEVLEQLILDRKKGVIAYKQLLQKYIELAKQVTNPEDNTKYPESIRSNGALRALFDNCGEDEELTLKLHKAVIKSKQDGFRHNLMKERRIKQELFKILNNVDEVERVYSIVKEQEEY
jgi:type I restriction enzyme R subunit